MQTLKQSLGPLALTVCWCLVGLTNSVMAQSVAEPLQTIDEEFRVDDGVPDGAPISFGDLIVVNRFTPTRYPATLKALRIYLRRVNPSPVGAQIRLIVFARTGSTSDAFVNRPTTFLVNQTVTVPNVSTTGEFAEFTVMTPPTINSGDFFVGFQQPNQVGAFFWFDTNEPYPLRSYVAVPPDGDFTSEFFPTGLQPAQPAVNFLIRAVMALPTAQPTVVAVSAASYQLGEVAAEAILAAYGVNLAPSVGIAETNPLPTTLNGTSIKVTDSAGATRNAGLFYVSPGQLNFELPQGTRGGAAMLTVTNGGGQMFTTTLNVAGVAAGIFTANANGLGVAAAQLLRIKADGSLVYDPVARFDVASNQWVPLPIVFGPESEQDFLILYGTGIRGRSNVGNVRVNVAQEGGAPLETLYAGPQGSLTGLDQINLRLPRTFAGKGEMHLRTTVDGRTANLVKVSFQ